MAIKIKNCVCVDSTPKARLIKSPEYPFDGKEMWVPYAAIDDDSEVYSKGHEGMCVIADWFAEQKGWV